MVPAFFLNVLCKTLKKQRQGRAQMAELVDALVSGASVERRAGSSPVLGTNLFY